MFSFCSRSVVVVLLYMLLLSCFATARGISVKNSTIFPQLYMYNSVLP